MIFLLIFQFYRLRLLLLVPAGIELKILQMHRFVSAALCSILRNNMLENC